jgi:hypothetical protein
MKASQEDTMQKKQQRGRFLKLASSGLLYIEMLKTTTESATYAKELGNRP